MSTIKVAYGKIGVQNIEGAENLVWIGFNPLESLGFTGKGHGKNVLVASTGTDRKIVPFLPTFDVQLTVWRSPCPEELLEQKKIAPEIMKDEKAVFDQSAMIAAGVKARPGIMALIAALNTPSANPAKAGDAAPATGANLPAASKARAKV